MDTTMNLTFVVGALLAVGLITLSRRQKLSRAPFPPGPKPRPFIGNIFDIITPEPWLLYMKWEEEYQSKILSVTLPGKRMVILNSAEDAIELLEKKAGVYSGRPKVPLIEMTGWSFNTGLMQTNERWRNERRVYHQNLRQDLVSQYQPLQSTNVHFMLRQLLTDPDSFAEHYKTLSAAVILEVMYGYEIKPKNDRIVEVVQRAVTILIENGANPSVAALNLFPALQRLPRWLPGTGFHQILDDARESAKDMLNTPFEYVRKCMREGSTKPSLVRSLLETNAIGEDSVKGIAGTAFAAGTDTVLSVLECFFFAIGLHPEKQRKAQEEIDRVIGSDRLPTFSDRDSLPYVDAVFREALRWLPPFPLTVPHVAEEDDVYKGYFIPKGSIVFPNVRAMTLDRAKFDDPESFVPERFINKDGKVNEDIRTLSFGFGKRICPGRYLATNTVWLVMATVMASFDIGLPYDKEGNPVKFQQVFTKADTLHLKPYKCSITPRSNNARKLVEATEYTGGY